MINGSSGLGQLTGLPSDPKNDNIHHIIAALESTVAEYFAQVLHFNYRLILGDNGNNVSASSAGQNPLNRDGQRATGTVTDRTRLRLKQNAVSTRILQGLLGVMGACLIASTALGRGARVIPRDPGSIASRMAYFADGVERTDGPTSRLRTMDWGCLVGGSCWIGGETIGKTLGTGHGGRSLRLIVRIVRCRESFPTLSLGFIVRLFILARLRLLCCLFRNKNVRVCWHQTVYVQNVVATHT